VVEGSQFGESWRGRAGDEAWSKKKGNWQKEFWRPEIPKVFSESSFSF
jgi:hypothetical protein